MLQALVVRGAVPLPVRFPFPLSIRACGFPAHGLPTVVWSWLRSFRVADSAEQLVQALVVDTVLSPTGRLTGTQVAAALLDEKPFEPPRHVTVELTELVGCVAGAEVVAPSPKEQVQRRERLFQLGSDPASIGEVSNPSACPFHRPL